MTLVILIVAAGAASRMRGGDKTLEPIDGQPLIACMAARAAQIAPTFVAVPSLDHPRARALLDQPVQIIPVPDADQGMSASLRTGIAALPVSSRAAMILPADMPDITAKDLSTMAKVWTEAPDHIHRATAADGTPGHPVIFPARLFPAFQALTGDEGARSILRGEPLRLTALPDMHATTDLDTPEAWEAWRARS